MHAAFPMLVWLAVGQLPAGTRAALTSDQMEEDEQHHLAVARGHVLLRTGGLVLHADELFYDTTSNRFEIRTPLFGVDATSLITASSASGSLGDRLGSDALELNDVRIEEFQWLAPDIGTARPVRRRGEATGPAGHGGRRHAAQAARPFALRARQRPGVPMRLSGHWQMPAGLGPGREPGRHSQRQLRAARCAAAEVVGSAGAPPEAAPALSTAQSQAQRVSPPASLLASPERLSHRRAVLPGAGREL